MNAQPHSTVCVVGLGYIGLPTAAVLANSGRRVHGVDVRLDVVDTINRGKIHIHEPQLDELVERVVASGKLTAHLDPCEADVFFICVPTPITEDHAPDLSYVEAACRSIAPYVRKGNLIILESTCPPGTTANVVAKHAAPRALTVGQDVFVAHCPERVLPGRILIEVIENDRIVGGMTDACTHQAKQFFESFVQGEVVGSNATTAEMAKLVENSFRDVNIAFANELSMLADRFDADPAEIIALANRHPRVNILTPGPGVGGHCISVDPWFLHHAEPGLTPLIRTAREVNDAKPHFVVRQIADIARQIPDAVIGCLGLAYKADVDDLRESPSVEIVQQLEALNIGRERLVCDPLIKQNASPFPLHSLEEVTRRCDILVLLTDHQPFREMPEATLADKVLVDPRGVWPQHQARRSSHAQKRAAA